MKSFEPPAGSDVQASTPRYVVSPLLGMTTERGLFNIVLICLNGSRRSKVQDIWSFPFLEAVFGRLKAWRGQLV